MVCKQVAAWAVCVATAGVAMGAAATAPTYQAGELPAVTVHLAGDSTVSEYPSTTKQEGWGMELKQFFNDKVTVDNQAQGGANVQSFKASGRWAKILENVKPGDYVLYQFGANDSGTAHGPVTPEDFAKTLEQMADEVKAKGGTSIFVTPSAFYEWKDGKELNARLAPYAEAAQKAGHEKGVMVADLNARGVEWLNKEGEEKTKDFYFPSRTGAPDKAHFLKAGAVKMAGLVAGELVRIGSPLGEYVLKNKLEGYQAPNDK
ncbi:MAG TPA: rhamnogalacturonan acetylesterase [Phycisphaerae bacterium]|nr:rhamnogalacturonan acetylesterase [Phycisphaerae bacterium]